MNKTARVIDIGTVIAILLFFVLVIGRTFFTPETPDEASAAVPGEVRLEDYNGKTMGTMVGSTMEKDIEKHFPESPILYFDGISEMSTALAVGKIDAFAFNVRTINMISKQIPEITAFPTELEVRQRYYCFQKNAKGAELCKQMNEMVREFRADGTLEAIEEIWFGEDDSKKVIDWSGLTGENGVLNVGTNSDDVPYNYYNANRELSGVNVDLIVRFCRRYGYKLNITDTSAASSLLAGLTQGRFDTLINLLSYSPERAETVLYSDPVLNNVSTLAVRAVDLDQVSSVTEAGFFEKISNSFYKNFILESRWKLIADGIKTTCFITLLALVFGTLLAFVVYIYRSSGSRVANIVCDLFVSITHGMPMVVLLLILYYIVFVKSSMAAEWIAVIGFTLHYTAVTSEVFRSGINGVDPGQREAALALGFREREAFFKFIFPQAIELVMPVYCTNAVTLLKGTAVVGYISIKDLTKMSDIIRSKTYEAIFPLIATAILYMVIGWLLMTLIRLLLNRIFIKHKIYNKS